MLKYEIIWYPDYPDMKNRKTRECPSLSNVKRELSRIGAKTKEDRYRLQCVVVDRKIIQEFDLMMMMGHIE